MNKLLTADSHFAFGDNWRSFSGLIDDKRILASDQAIDRLLPTELMDKSVLDIGCGSGLPALSMLRKGARHITCVDIDAASVATARDTLSKHAPSEVWAAEVASVFDLTGQFDVVYSWGVLHHTGDMRRAVRHAASLVVPGGVLAIALYAKTPLCGFWRIFKRVYSRSPRPVQSLAQAAFGGLINFARLVTGRSRRGVSDRGMDEKHDLHDWLGGYPYESATLADVQAMLPDLELVRHNRHFDPRTLGILGSGCDEYVFSRPDPNTAG